MLLVMCFTLVVVRKRKKSKDKFSVVVSAMENEILVEGVILEVAVVAVALPVVVIATAVEAGRHLSLYL